MADPFDFSTADPNAPGFLGQSVGFWRDLASFGGNLAAAANQRTASGHLANGTGFAGPLGAATTATMEQGRDNALARSRMAYQNAQTQGAGMQNQLLASQLPLQIAQNEALRKAWSDPSYLKQLLQQWGVGSGMPGDGAAPGMPQPDSQPSSYAASVLKGEGTGQNPRSSATGSGQFIDSTWQQFAHENPTYFSGMTPDQIMGARSDPALGAKATEWYAGKNAEAFRAGGVQPTGPNLAMAHTLGPKAAMAVAQAPDNVPLGDVLRASLGDETARQYVTANPNFAAMTTGGLKSQYAGTPNFSGGGAQQAQQASGGQPTGNQYSPQAQHAFAMAKYYEQEANRLEIIKTMAPKGFPIPGDPAVMRQTGQQWLTMALAGPTEAAKGAAGAPFQINRVNAGGVLFDGNGQVKGYAPVQSDEVVTEGPQMGMHGTVLRNPVTNEIVGQHAGGGGGENGIPAGFIPKQLSPQQQERLKGSGEVETHDITHDRKMIEDDLSHVVENTIPAKQQLLHLRDLTEPAGTGFAAETRLAFKNAIQTISPDFAKAVDLNASPMQEFQKISTMGAGKQERADQGAKGGFRLMELYLKANPNLENQPDANKHMANLLLVSHQIHEDYATGANDFYQKNRDSFTASPPGKYTPISQYDGAFIQKMRPEVYKSAVDALNGKPYAEWSKGLTGPQMQIVGGVLQRADPNSTVDIQGQQMPVSAFTKTLGPTQIAASNAR